MLEKLELFDFRNHENSKFNFTENSVVFWGQNGIGKTNILEAISVLSTGKSWRETTASDLILHQNINLNSSKNNQLTADSAKISAIFKYHHFEVLIQDKSRNFFKNKKKISLKSHLGQIPTILFCPEFLELFSGTKAGRLRFFDRFLVQVYPKYREILARATKSHKQKTALLRASFEYEKTYLEAQLTIWNNILIETIPQIIKIREEFLTAINPIIQAELSKILASSDTISFKLQKAEDINSTEESVKNWLAQNKSREILSQKNYISPSRDDFQCFFREKNILQTASRGETRAILLALLSAKKRWLQENFKINPILLLDDVFSELDAQRQNQLENICKNSQVFFTTTHKSHFAKFSQNIKTFEIK